MLNLAVMATDIEKKEEGVQCFYPDGEGAWARIRSMDSKAVQKALKDIPEDVRRKIDSGQISKDEAEEVWSEAFADALVTEWHDFGNVDGPMECNRANKIAWFQGSDEYRAWVFARSKEKKFFRVDYERAAEGN